MVNLFINEGIMLDAGRNYVILAAALLVLTAALKLHDGGNTSSGSFALVGDTKRECQASGFNLSTKRVGCQGSGAAFGR